MKKHFLPLILSMFPFIGLFSQKDFRSGYIVSFTNDTTYGEIDYRGNIWLGKQCCFRLDKDSEVTVYGPRDIAAYRFVDGRYFVSEQVAEGLVFLEVLVKGELNLYYWKDRYREHYYVEKTGLPLTEIPYSDETITIDGREYARNNAHFGALNYYTQDAPALRQQVMKMKKLTPQNMIQLAESYHNMVCDDYSCVVYQTQPPKVSVALELAGGAFRTFRSEKAGNTGGKWGVVPALYVHVCLPRVSERFYLRTGFAGQIFPDTKWFLSEADEFYYYYPAYGYHGSGDIRTHFFKIPIQAEYQSARGVVRPKVACGVTYYFPFHFVLSGMAGLNFFFNEHWALSLQYEIDAFPARTGFYPKYRGGQSLQAGVYMKF